MADVLYTTRWNILTRRPIAEHSWITEEEARRRYEANEGVEIVEAAERDERGNPRARWVIGAYAGFRVQFLSPAGSVLRLVDWDLIDGRLWRWVTVDYNYPDDNRRYEMAESLLTIKTSARPDGTGSMSVSNKELEQTDVTHFSDVATDSYWMDVPAFGDWDRLTDPS